MYGGLFGDLPAAKKQSHDNNNEDGEDDDVEIDQSSTMHAVSRRRSSKAQSGPSPTEEGDNYSDAKSQQHSTAVPAAGLFPRPRAPPTAAAAGAAAISRKKARRTDHHGGGGSVASSSHQFLQTLGKAGTSMAFVPTAALKRKVSLNGNNKQPPAPGRANATTRELVVTPAGTGTATAAASGSTPASSSASEVETPAGSGNNNVALYPLDMGDVVVTTTIVRQKSASTSNPSAAAGAVNIHGGAVVVSVPWNTGEPTQHDSTPGNDQATDANLVVQQQQQQLQQAHTADVAEITDPYDPYMPNDLLQYWERQALAQEREKLERETRESLERQRLLRERLEQERQELQQSGNYQELIQRHHAGGTGAADVVVVAGGAVGSGGTSAFQQGGMGRGRGRGRGVSNLPAWLVEKQRKMQEQEGLGSGERAAGDGTDGDMGA